jgi:hypothetical protein
MSGMTHNQRVAAFAIILVGTAVVLFGWKGLTTILPGPSAK